MRPQLHHQLGLEGEGGGSSPPRALGGPPRSLTSGLTAGARFLNYAFVVFGALPYVALLGRPGWLAAQRILHSHGRGRGAKVRLAAFHGGHAGTGFLGLRVDDGVDSFRCTFTLSREPGLHTWVGR